MRACVRAERTNHNRSHYKCEYLRTPTGGLAPRRRLALAPLTANTFCDHRVAVYNAITLTMVLMPKLALELTLELIFIYTDTGIETDADGDTDPTLTLNADIDILSMRLALTLPCR